MPLWPAYALPWVLGNGVAVLALMPVLAVCAFRAQRRPRELRLAAPAPALAATWARRTAAMLLDALVTMFLWQLLLRLLLFVYEFDDESSGLPVLMVVLHLAVFFAYFVLCEAMTGQTLGKRLLTIRVVAEDGSPLSLRSAVVRNLLRPPPLMMPAAYLVGSIVLLVTPRWQRVGDLLAGTVVVELPPAAPAAR